MNKDLVIKFLLNEELKFKKPENMEVSDVKVWAAVYKAHLDTLTGRFNLEKYRVLKNEDGYNKVVVFLYNEIENRIQKSIPLSSGSLIESVNEEFDVEFGAIQKLVNMTLKYIIVLNAVDDLNVDVNEKECDCPIDSKILEQLKKDTKMSHTVWTKLEPGEYEMIQKEIRGQLKEGQGNIAYDFYNWK